VAAVLLYSFLASRNAAIVSVSPTTRSWRITRDTRATHLILSWNTSPSAGLVHHAATVLKLSEESLGDLAALILQVNSALDLMARPLS
jgi:hypothetical protein